MHEIDLNKIIDRCDLVNDINISNSKITYLKKKIRVEKINIDKNLSKLINKRSGKYISLLFEDVTDIDNRNNLVNVLTSELNELLNEKHLVGKSSLVVGLGNNLSTPDSLGPKTIDNIITTRHLFLTSKLDKNYSSVAKISPGVFASTGIESYDIIKGIIKEIHPNFLIIIDALSSTNIKNVNRIIQITDSGIDPGSGVGNERKELSKKSLGIETIAIGIPTVVNLHTIVRDLLKDYNVENVLKNDNNNYLVTPKEIDFVIEKLSFVLSKSINNALHKLTK